MKLRVDFALITPAETPDEEIKEALNKVNTSFDTLLAEDENFQAYVTGAAALTSSPYLSGDVADAVLDDVDEVLRTHIEELLDPTFPSYTLEQISWTLYEEPLNREEML